MTARIGLALALHNHQPVGNFGWVIAESYERAYEPMLAALDRHPGVRVALHYSGPLLDWLRRERPEFVDHLRELVARRQVEIVGGGRYEPVLASLPERDRIGQLTRMADELEATFGERPVGAWLAERVWEPDLPVALAEAGYGWTVLDDAHFRAAAIAEEALWGPYTTDDQGRVLTVFGTEQGLRYRIPFADVEDVIAYLLAHATEAGDRVGTMGDDGEKFGSWPTTYEHCWRRGWVDRFFDALESNRSWLTTVTPSDWLAGHAPVGRVYLPTGSYAEMGEWALPADEAVAFAAAVRRAKDHGRPERRWLRGAMWRNFQVRYREVNDLHKQMLRVSDLVERMPPGHARETAREHLYAGQSNDSYWHGLFGGLYLPDLRVAAASHLIAAEDLACSTLGVDDSSAELVDLDLDGRLEGLLRSEGLVVGVKLDEGAGIGRLDVRAARFPLASVVRRRPEAYHERIRAHDHGVDAQAQDEGSPRDAVTAAAAASIHDIVAMKHAGLAERLVYDDHERRSGLVRLYAPGTTSGDVAAGAVPPIADLATIEWEPVSMTGGEMLVRRDTTLSVGMPAVPIRVQKLLVLAGGRLDPSLRLETSVANLGGDPLDVRMAIEWNTLLLGGGRNPAAWYELHGRRISHDGRADLIGCDAIRCGNDDIGLSIDTRFDPPAEIAIGPVETVSKSEAGFEIVYQGSTLVALWPVQLAGGAAARFTIEHLMTVARDKRS